MNRQSRGRYNFYLHVSSGVKRVENPSVFVPVIRENSFEGHSSKLNFSKSLASNWSEDDSIEASTRTKHLLDLHYFVRGPLYAKWLPSNPSFFLRNACLRRILQESIYFSSHFSIVGSMFVNS